MTPPDDVDVQSLLDRLEQLSHTIDLMAETLGGLGFEMEDFFEAVATP